MEASEPSTSAKDNINTNPSNQSNRSDANPIEKTSVESVDDFLSTGRTGRRNALPDILEQNASHVNTSDLPNQLQKMTFEDSTQHNGSSGSSSSGSTPSCSNQNK